MAGGGEAAFEGEPDKASEALWIDPTKPPDDVIDHCAQALTAITRGEAFSVHGWTDPG